MTTKIIIMNEGPEDVKVEIKGRDAEGKFTAQDEVIVTRGTFVYQYLHEAQSVQIFEQKFIETQYE